MLGSPHGANGPRGEAGLHWPDRIYAALKRHSIGQVALVPDAGHSRLITLCLADNDLRVATLTTEEEGVALMQGARLGGERAVLLLQSSGVGNCVNMLSLATMHRRPMPMLVTMRGDFGEFNPAQIPMGRATQAVLEAMGTLVQRADTEADVEPVVEATLKFACLTFRLAAALIGRRVIGAEVFGEKA